ncbi:hypothetical protein PG993_003915 [Apiospora rasikravindrae]|uniref:Uncharacterized protein n=1 Tax=Apiospora rasikravindrae TaxID=990691 RepID=A0ABR1U0W5_9PEZI
MGPILEAVERCDATGTSPSCICPELIEHVPSGTKLQDIAAGLDKLSSTSDTLKSLRVIQACLGSHQDGLEDETEDVSSALSEIGDYVGRTILPVVQISNNGDDDEDDDPASAAQVQFLFKGELGLNILHTLTIRHPFTLSPSALLSVVAYTNPQDPWTSDASADLAHSLLQSHFSQEETPARTEKKLSRGGFITDTLLTQHLRPLFSKSRPATVTASGRKAAFVEDRPSTVLEDKAAKAWKYSHVYAVTVFEWAVTTAATTTATTTTTTKPNDAAPVPLLSRAWHMFTPILLTLLDESETALKVRALGIFGAFWSGCPPGLMDQVGLASVFEEAVFPAVHFLPNITPEAESRLILDAAYPALFQLAGLTTLAADRDDDTAKAALTPAQRRLLDRIIREGILTGYFHAKDHVQLTYVFCDKLSYAVNGMGILSVKYLKDILPTISEVMTNPFGTKHPPSLLAAIQLLQAVLRCCWPRIPGYQNEIIRILTVCWLIIADEDTWTIQAPTKKDLEAQLTKTAALLSSIIRNDSQQGQDQPSIKLDDLVSPLIKKEPLLAPLFARPQDISPVN